jgi:putative flippase GtrA
MLASEMSEDGGLRVLIGQMWRFGLSGGLATLLNGGIYWLAAVPLHVWPLAANVIGWIAAVISGYVLHSRWSFRGHGRRDNVARTTSRFFVVALISFGLNSFWIWLFTGVFHTTPSWPILPMTFVTPLVTFALNRRWVFA